MYLIIKQLHTQVNLFLRIISIHVFFEITLFNVSGLKFPWRWNPKLSNSSANVEELKMYVFMFLLLVRQLVVTQKFQVH